MNWPDASLTYWSSGVTYDAVEAAYVGYCYGDSTCGQVRDNLILLLSGTISTRHSESTLQPWFDWYTYH